MNEIHVQHAELKTAIAQSAPSNAPQSGLQGSALPWVGAVSGDWFPSPSLSYPSPFLSTSPPPLLSNSATRLGPQPDRHLYTEPSCHTIPCSEPGHKALIKTHDFKLSKLSKSRKDGEGKRKNKETEGERHTDTQERKIERERERDRGKERENVRIHTEGGVKQTFLSE